MNFRTGSLIACVCLFVLFINAGGQLEAASIIQVPGDQPTIQSAITAASNGDTVQVAPGTYVENLNFSGKAIRVTSVQGPAVTIIDGNHAGSVVTVASGEGPQSVLNGFTVRNGNATASSAEGGGISISNSSPTITGNTIINNSAANGGGGISVSFGSPLIQGNLIKNNGQTSGYSGGVGGGGIAIVGSASAQVLNNTISNNSWSSSSGGGITLFAAGTPMIANNVVSNNTAYSQGGGFYIVNQSDASIVQNLIVGNSAGTGGGLYWLVPSGGRGPFLISNTIYGNLSPQGSGIFADGFDAQAQITNNIIVAASGQTAVTCGNFTSSVPVFLTNDAVSSSGAPYGGTCGNQTGLNGNISADPLFVSNGSDFHLQRGSPAIDAGTNGNTMPQHDFDGITRPLDGNGDGTAILDMGIYEAPVLDLTPPVTVALATPAAGSAGWNTTNVSVTLTATDNAGGSGVQSIGYSLSGAQIGSGVVAGNSATIAITGAGITTVSYAAVDAAGNVEPTKSLTIKIDKTAPVISGMPLPGCTLSPPKRQLVQVASVSASDSLSGIVSFNVTASSNPPAAPGDIVITGGTVQLRAVKGAVYTVVATAGDAAGNTTTATATCSVGK